MYPTDEDTTVSKQIVNHFPMQYHVYGRLLDAPQVRIESVVQGFPSLDAAKEWCIQRLFDWHIYTLNEEGVRDGSSRKNIVLTSEG